MSTPEINQVLAQMRVARAQAAGGVGIEEMPQNDFSDLLKRSIDSVNETQQQANFAAYRVSSRARRGWISPT